MRGILAQPVGIHATRWEAHVQDKVQVRGGTVRMPHMSSVQYSALTDRHPCPHDSSLTQAQR